MKRAPLHDRARVEAAEATDRDYADAARRALRAKDLKLAIQQVSAAIVLDPLNEPHLRLLDEIIAAARGPLLLVELPEDGAFYGLCAARARVLARVDRTDEAIAMLFDVAAFRPATPFLEWARAWARPRKNARRIEPKTLATGMVELATAARDLPFSRGLVSNLEVALELEERVRDAHGPSTELVVARSRVLRALDRPEEAAAVLDAFEGPRGWELEVERAAIHRERGDTRAQIDCLTRAVAARPGDVSAHLDIGDAHLDDGALDEATAAYQAALAVDPTSEWANLSTAYARALAVNAPSITELVVNPDDARLAARAHAIDVDLSAYATRLADPTDPIASVIRGVLTGAHSQDPSVKLRVKVRAERPLSPSARLAFSIGLATIQREGTLHVEPSSPTSNMGPLWTSPPPPDAAIERALELATTVFGWDSWCELATTLSANLDVETATPHLAAMAHVPWPTSPDVDPIRWVHAFQTATALLWATSPIPPRARAEQLFPLLAGTDDWTSAAALLALRALARALALDGTAGGSGPPHAERPLERASPETALLAEILARATALLPDSASPLPPHARALAALGCDIASGEALRPFLRLRARIRRDLSDHVHDATRAREAGRD